VTVTPARLTPALAALFLPLALAAAPGISTSGSLTAAWNDNLSHSARPIDQRNAETFSASGAFSQRFILSRDDALLFGGTANTRICPEFDGLDDVSFAVQLELRRKFGLGPLAPVLALQTEAGGGLYREAARNAWTTTARLTASKRLNDAWRVAVTGEWSDRNANQAVFSRVNRGLSAEVSWDVTDIWQLDAGACRQWGEQEANASWATWSGAMAGFAGPALADYYMRIPWRMSDTFGSGWVAYRIDGRTDLWWLALAPAIARNTSLPLRYDHIDVHGSAGSHYVSHQISLSVVHRF
jgi:hypothetical protein